MNKFITVTAFGFVSLSRAIPTLAEPVKAESVLLSVLRTPEDVDGAQPPCAGEEVADSADAIASDMAAVGGPGICAFGCGPDIAAALASSVARASAHLASSWGTPGSANCAVTCAAIPPNATLADPSEFLIKVRPSRPIAVYMTDGTNKGTWQPTDQGTWHGGSAGFRWDPENAFRPVTDAKSHKIKFQLVCKQFRNWSPSEDRQAKFNVWYDPLTQ